MAPDMHAGLVARLPVIGIVGAMGAGKSTIAQVLVREFGARRASMADPIKDMLMAMGLSRFDVSGPNAHRAAGLDFLGGRSPRFALQTLGTQWGRKTISGDIWVNAMKQRIGNNWPASDKYYTAPHGTQMTVIDDIRFPNEFNMVLDLGGEIWRVMRPGVGQERTPVDIALHGLGWHPFLHESEYHWRDAPASVQFWNNGSEEDMCVAVREHMETNERATQWVSPVDV